MPPAKKHRVMVTLEGPIKKRLDIQCQERGYSMSMLIEKAVIAFLVQLERVPTLDEQILAIVNQPLQLTVDQKEKKEGEG
jgi:hypothetical protein